MRRKTVFALILILLSLTGCSQSPAESIKDMPAAKTSDNEPLPNVNNHSNYFFEPGISSFTYEGRFLDLSMQTEQIELSVTEVRQFEEGSLYELVWNCDKDMQDSRGENRKYVGLFFVSDDSIYFIRDKEAKEKLTTADELKQIGTLVCSKSGKEDILDENEKGWHEYILVKDNQCEYHGYNNLVETGYYECFVWELGKGLIEYRTGYGAESDAIEVHLSANEN